MNIFPRIEILDSLVVISILSTVSLFSMILPVAAQNNTLNIEEQLKLAAERVQQTKPEHTDLNISKAVEDNVAKDLALLHPSYGKLQVPIVSVVYQSPTTVILQGDLIQIYGIPAEFNTYLWSSMDLLKNEYGFKLQQVITTGTGTIEDPVTVYILMTK